MSSNLITPPDVILDPDSIFIINMLEPELANLVDYLRTVPQKHNIHLYHSDMAEHHNYAHKLAGRIPYLLVNIKFVYPMVQELKDLLRDREDVIYFGPRTPYAEPVDWFLEKFKTN